jgi:aminoglycoside phosphotransferase (APT) family kinase protein
VEGESVIGPEDLTAAWFERVLAARHPGIRVAAADVTSVKEMTNTHVLVSLGYDEPSGAPARVFVKLPPIDTRRRELLGTSGMGANEARFYERLAPLLTLRVPVPHAAFTEDDGGFVMVLEDLEHTGCTTYDGLTGVPPDAAAVALEELAAMHVHYEPAQARAELSWIAPPKTSRPVDLDAPDISTKLLRRGLEKYRDRIGDGYAAVSERLLADRAAVNELWAAALPTVVHGDLHLGNLFDDHGRIGFFDWGLMAVADPLRDASYFLCLALDIEDRRAHERALLQHYLAARRALGGRDISWNEAWERHRVWAAYTVLASCQAIQVPYGATEQTHRFANAFLERSKAAVSDLDAAAAIASI